MIYYPGNLYNWPTIILLHNFKSDIILLICYTILYISLFTLLQSILQSYIFITYIDTDPDTSL